MSLVHPKKEYAIQLRRNGLSYSEILRKVSVAKSTLAGWLYSVALSKKQTQRLTAKKIAAQKRGLAKMYEAKLARIKSQKDLAHESFKKYSKDPLWLLGTALYWAEGSKSKPWRMSSKVVFSNMDPNTLRLILIWLQKYLKVKDENIVYELYIHETAFARAEGMKNYWKKQLNFPDASLRVYKKKSKLSEKKYRRNTEETYHGLMRLSIKKSAGINHQIGQWIEDVCNTYCRVV